MNMSKSHFYLVNHIIRGVPYLFPRSIYDAFGGTKKLTISDRFGEEMRLEIGRERKVSFSISPLAESYANFGLYGGIALAFIISIFTLFVYSTYYKSSIPIIVLWGSHKHQYIYLLTEPLLPPHSVPLYGLHLLWHLVT